MKLKVRELRMDEVTFEMKVEQDDTLVRGNAIASGDDAVDKKVEDEILERLERGDVWAWASVTVVARWHGFQGTDNLCGCNYENESDFLSCDYYTDMEKSALADLNHSLSCLLARLEELVIPDDLPQK